MPNAPITIYGTMIKTFAESETLVPAHHLVRRHDECDRDAAAAPTALGTLTALGAVISTATGTTNFIMGAGTTENFSVRTGTAYFNLGANSTLTISVPIMQNTKRQLAQLQHHGAGNDDSLRHQLLRQRRHRRRRHGPGSAYNSIAGNLELAGSLTFPSIGTGATESSRSATAPR